MGGLDKHSESQTPVATKSITEYWLFEFGQTTAPADPSPKFLGRYTSRESALLATEYYPGRYIVKVEKAAHNLIDNKENV